MHSKYLAPYACHHMYSESKIAVKKCYSSEETEMNEIMFIRNVGECDVLKKI